MAQIRTKERKKNPHYGFLVSWQPKGISQAHVKGESILKKNTDSAINRHNKSADYMAQDKPEARNKNGIIRSLILVSFILILELVIYLAWNKFS